MVSEGETEVDKTNFKSVSVQGNHSKTSSTENTLLPAGEPMKHYGFLCCDCYVKESVKVDGIMLHVPIDRWKWLLVVTNVPFFYMSILLLAEPSSATNWLERVVVSILCAMCGIISTYFHWIQCYVNPISRAIIELHCCWTWLFVGSVDLL